MRLLILRTPMCQIWNHLQSIHCLLPAEASKPCNNTRNTKGIESQLASVLRLVLSGRLTKFLPKASFAIFQPKPAPFSNSEEPLCIDF